VRATVAAAIVFFMMATSLMAFPDAIDNGPRARGGKLKFGHAPDRVSPAIAHFPE
jgi:hypothetical protein